MAEQKRQAGDLAAWERYYEKAKELYGQTIPMTPCPKCAVFERAGASTRATVPDSEKKCATCGHWKNRDEDGERNGPHDTMWCIHPRHKMRTDADERCRDWEPVGQTSC